MRYRIIDKSEVWEKIKEGRALYYCNFENNRISNCGFMTINTLESALTLDSIIFIEDIAPDYDNQQDGE